MSKNELRTFIEVITTSHFSNENFYFFPHFRIATSIKSIKYKTRQLTIFRKSESDSTPATQRFHVGKFFTSFCFGNILIKNRIAFYAVHNIRKTFGVFIPSFGY